MPTLLRLWMLGIGNTHQLLLDLKNKCTVYSRISFERILRNNQLCLSGQLWKNIWFSRWKSSHLKCTIRHFYIVINLNDFRLPSQKKRSNNRFVLIWRGTEILAGWDYELNYKSKRLVGVALEVNLGECTCNIYGFQQRRLTTWL